MKIIYELVECLDESDESVVVMHTENVDEIDKYLRDNIETVKFRDLRVEIIVV